MSILDYRVHVLETAVRQLQAERDGDERLRRCRDARARLDAAKRVDNMRGPTPLRDTCKCDERMSRYKSSLGVTVPLSYRSRHLMEELRHAATEAIAAGEYGERLQAARLALAERLSELEQRVIRADHAARHGWPHCDSHRTFEYDCIDCNDARCKR